MTKILQGLKKEDSYQDVLQVNLQLQEQELFKYMEYYEQLLGELIYCFNYKQKFMSSRKIRNIFRLLKIEQNEDYLYWTAILYLEVQLPDFIKIKYKSEYDGYVYQNTQLNYELNVSPVYFYVLKQIYNLRLIYQNNLIKLQNNQNIDIMDSQSIQEQNVVR